MGDFNAKVGHTENDEDIREIVGKHGLGSRNDRGERIIGFCAENELFIANTGFQHHARRVFTWLSPDGATKNQIDYILIKNRWRTFIWDIKTYPGMDCGSDHNAVGEICLKLKNIRKPAAMKNDWHLAGEPIYADMAAQAISAVNSRLTLECNPNDLWAEMKDALRKTAVRFKPKPKPRKSWISDTTWKLIEKKEN